MLMFEIYITKKQVLDGEWLSLIHTISKYNGILRKWKIIVVIQKNQIRYFVQTKYSLPATINNLSSFLLKPISSFTLPKSQFTLLSTKGSECNMIDLINHSEIKRKGIVKYLEIEFYEIYKKKTLSKIYSYLYKNKKIQKYCLLFANSVKMLSVNFEENKRFFYKTAPKYLDISKILNLLNTDKNNALLNIETFPYLQGKFYLSQGNFSFDKHSIIMGSSGCGKSKFISLLIYNIYKSEILKQKYKVVVIDPHAALENDIGGLGEVIDFKTKLDSINLFMNQHDDVVSSTELLLELFKSLIADQYNSKLERVLRHSVHLLLTNETFCFKTLRKVILDLEYRNSLIKKLKENLPVSVIDFFLTDFNELKTRSYGEAISPIIGFIDEMEMIPVFNSEDHLEDLKTKIKDNFLTVFSLDRIKLGDKVIKAISGLIMQQLLTIIQKRAIEEHIIFIIDEIAVVENPILSRFLSEARKYHLSLVIAGQYFNQISTELKNSIFANTINYFIFRVSKLDAYSLADNFNMKIPLDDTKERKIKLLSELNNRECIARVDVNGILLPAVKGNTIDFVSIPRKKIEISDQEIKRINKENKKYQFKMSTQVKLKDILIANSTNKKGVEKNE